MQRCAAVSLALALLVPCLSYGQGIKISVEPEDARRAAHVPLTACLDDDLADIPDGAYVEAATAEALACEAQICSLGPWGCDATPTGRRWLAVAAPGGFGDSTIKLIPGSPETAFSWTEDDVALRLVESGSPVLAYNFGMILKEGVPEDRRRACYFHPVYDLDGRVITDDFPKDHYHHRGMAWMWPGVWYGEKRVNQWEIKGVRQKLVRWLGREVGPVCAVFGVEGGWFLDDETKMAEEIAWYRIFRTGDHGRAIDVHYTLKAVDQPIRIQGTLAEDKGYGGFCFRFGPREGTRITSPQGLEGKDSNRIPYPWVDFSAKFAGADKYSGAAIFDYPGNPGFPNGWTIRHYGFLGPAWPGLEVVTLEPGKSFTLEYRVWIHRGNAEEGAVADVWDTYVQPPKIVVTPVRQE